MIWQYILTAISAALFFGFVALCWAKYGLKDCYSAYGPAWAKTPPFSWYLNPWCFVTGGTAAMLIPVMLETTVGSVWQFTGFLCPAILIFVALTPDYGKDKLANVMHQIGAKGAALWAVLFIIFNAPSLWWLLVLYIALAGICTLAFGKWSWCFWAEMAAYLGIYTAVFIMISK
jgi:hypothetical protein